MRINAPIPWMSYPAMLLAIVLATGIWIGNHGVPSSVALVTGAAALVMAGFSLARGHRRLISLMPLSASVGAYAVVLAMGVALIQMDRGRPDHNIGRVLADVPSLAGANGIVLHGVLDEFPSGTVYGHRLVVGAEALEINGKRFEVDGRVQVSMRPDAAGNRFEIGDDLLIRGRISPLPKPRNPADFDYGTYLSRRRVDAVMRVDGAEDVQIIGARVSWKRSLVQPLRSHFSAAIEQNVAREKPRAVLRALMLGDRSGIDARTREHFAATGLMHLLAVSGLHVLLVGMVLYTVLRPVLTRLGLGWWMTEVIRAAVTLTVLCSYMLVTGAPASVVRAVTMAAVLIGGVLVQRASPGLNSLGVAALVLLYFRPAHLFDVGFQLSFAAVAGIMCLKPVFDGWVPYRFKRTWFVKRPLDLALVSVAATLATMPVVLFHFGRVPFSGVLLNLIGIPATFMVLASGLAAAFFHGWLPGAAGAYGASAVLFAEVLLDTARLGESTFSWLSVRSFVRELTMLGPMVLGLLAVTHWSRPRVRWRLVAAGLLLLASGTWWSGTIKPLRPHMDVIFFDVGQGDAALVRLPDGRHLLFDAGIRDLHTNSGDRVLLPHFARFGIRSIDAAFISHPHADHLGGLPAVLRRVPVAHVYHNGQPYQSSLFDEKLHLLDSLQIPHTGVIAGDLLRFGSVSAQVLYPPYRPATPRNANDYSVVVRLNYGDTSFLFAGDAERAAEYRLSDTFPKLLRSSVIKVGHHGSRTSSTEEFVAAACPDPSEAPIAVISVAERNRYRHPSAEVVQRWRDCGAEVLKTKHEGAVWLRSDGRRIQRVRWK